MAIAIDAPVRVFRIGALLLQDPAPSLPPEEALAMYEPNFPQVQGATLEPPESRGDGALVYAVQRAAVRTKG